MLLGGFNHVAVMTKDTDRLHTFYREVFGATVFHDFRDGELRFSLIDVGPTAHINIFELAGNAEADRQTPMFGRGRIDHIGLEAVSHEAPMRFETGSSRAGPRTDSLRTLVLR